MKRVNVFVDGGARGNPGQAGAGILVENSEGRMIKKILKPLGVATNNEAEYHAVIIGLENALDILGGEAKEAEINLYLDSELVGRQLKGEYRVKSAKLKSLHQKAYRPQEYRLHRAEANRQGICLFQRHFYGAGSHHVDLRSQYP